MALACQRNSYLKEFSSKVTSCEPASITQTVNGKKSKLNGFKVNLEDTILFPEGGGQPDDRGTINGIDVMKVEKCGSTVNHYVPSPVDVGTEVDIKVDWMRRFDNMQQHSGQHLITAVINENYGFDTTSWWLGEKTSFIELDTTTLTPQQMQHIEDECNEKIRASIPVTVTLYDNKDDPRLAEARSRGLPDDLEGAVRIVTIEGVEDDLCCGTHVSNLSHLQAVKLLGVEKGKKNKCNLLFLVGTRVIKYLHQCCDREKTLTALLKNQAEDHPMLVEKMQKSLQITRKACSTLLRDLAVLEAQQFKANGNTKFFSLHRKDGDGDYMNAIITEINDPNVIIFLSVGDENGAGQFVLSAPVDVVNQVGSKVAELLDGKGGGKNGRFQGKANKLNNRKKVEQLLLQHISTDS